MTLKFDVMRTAVYPGSFNPFTKGHLDIVARALRLFDKVIIAVGYNVRKQGAADAASATYDSLSALFKGFDRVECRLYSGLTADLVAETEACCIIRGVRNAADFDYEKPMADTNAAIAGVETVLLPADPSLSYVSSSMIRELRHFGRDTARFEASREDVARALSNQIYR